MVSRWLILEKKTILKTEQFNYNLVHVAFLGHDTSANFSNWYERKLLKSNNTDKRETSGRSPVRSGSSREIRLNVI